VNVFPGRHTSCTIQTPIWFVAGYRQNPNGLFGVAYEA
jgi:hypothetical protein